MASSTTHLSRHTLAPFTIIKLVPSLEPGALDRKTAGHNADMALAVRRVL